MNHNLELFTERINRVFSKLRIYTIFFVAFFLFSGHYVNARSKVFVKPGMDYQNVFSSSNTEFVISTDINLENKRIEIGEGSILVFNGGSFSNGYVVGNHTKVKSANYEIFRRGYTRFRAYISKSAKSAISIVSEYHNSIVLEGTWDNESCGTQWTGLLNKSEEDVMLAVKNYILLHAERTKVKFPIFNALGYQTTKIPGNRYIDFNNSTISYPDKLSAWEDKTIAIPPGAEAAELETLYGLLVTKSNTTIANLCLDGKSNYRQMETLRLGVSCLVCLDNSSNVLLENIHIVNTLGPAVVSHSKAKDITFRNCLFQNIGEHILYSHQYLGFCFFDGCVFDTWDSKRLSEYRKGLNFVFKHVPPYGSGDISDDDIYSFDLTFRGCSFNNPKRVNAQKRTLGGFLTGTFPLVVNLIDCDFKGVLPMLNPAGGSGITEKTKKPFRMNIRGCNGAPYAYSSKANYNIIVDYYNCRNIPFRTVYARKYENCEVFFDLYEDAFENVSDFFSKEFSEPLIVKNCKFIDRGNAVRINHPIQHRPVVFENCSFRSDVYRNGSSALVNISSKNLPYLSFYFCDFFLPHFVLAGGNNINTLTIKNCNFKAIDKKIVSVKTTKQIMSICSFEINE